MFELAGLAAAPVEAAAGAAAGAAGAPVASGAAGIGQLIQGIISGLAGLFSVGANIFNNERTNRANAANVAAVNTANVDLWREQSLYNSPVEQMKRLKMAGINPSLIYGQGGIENLAGAAPQMQSPRNQALYLDPLAAAQIAKLNAETKSIEHQTKREDEKQPFNIDNLRSQIEQRRADVHKMSVEEQDIYSRITYRVAQTEISQRTADAQIERWNAQNGVDEQLKLKTAEEYRQLVALYSLREQGVRLTNAQIAAQLKISEKELDVMDKRIYLMTAQESESGARGNWYAEQSETERQNRPFANQLLQDQDTLVKNQAEYWDDYVDNPYRYKLSPDGFIMPGSPSGRRGSRGSNRAQPVKKLR